MPRSAPRPALSLVSGSVNHFAGQRSLRPARLPVTGPAISPAALKDALAANWSRFCMRAFPDDVEGGAAFFDVTVQCFRNWLAGDVCRPSGHHVTLAVLRFGPVVAEMLGDGAVCAPLKRAA